MDAHGQETCNKRVVQQWTAKGTTSRWNNEERNAPITANHHDMNGAVQPVGLIA